MKNVRVGMLMLVLVVGLSACASESATPGPSGPSAPEPGPDVYTDPGTEPPAPITEPSVMTSAVVSVSDAAENLLSVTLAGFGVERSGEMVPVEDLDPGSFTLVENGVVQGIKVDRAAPDTPIATDIVFVLDTTASMGVGLSSAKDSITGFASLLEKEGLNVRLGALTFGDAFDTKAAQSVRSGVSFQNKTPPNFDALERPSFALGENLAAFKTFIEEESPRGGGASPENIAGALEYAYDTFTWRDGAQRILVVITDTCAHTQASSSYTDFITAPWLPRPLDAVTADLRGHASVYVIGADEPCGGIGNTFDPELLTGPSGTGGAFYKWFDGGAYERFDLASLTLSEVLAGGYRLTYKGEMNAQPKELRLVIDNGADVRGELTMEASY